MKKIVYTCDVCEKILSEEPKDIFTLPLQIGYYTSGHIIEVPHPPKIVTKSYMLCNKCQHDIASYLLDRGIMTY